MVMEQHWGHGDSPKDNGSKWGCSFTPNATDMEL